jgi:hypothetical protein
VIMAWARDHTAKLCKYADNLEVPQLISKASNGP